MNNDLIFRSAVLNVLQTPEGAAILGNSHVRYLKAKALFEEIPTVDAGPKWISVKDRLPEQSGQVVAMTLSLDGERVNCIMNMNYSARHKAFNALDDDSVVRARKTEIHPAFWMPMPKVPKED